MGVWLLGVDVGVGAGVGVGVGVGVQARWQQKINEWGPGDRPERDRSVCTCTWRGDPRHTTQLARHTELPFSPLSPLPTASTTHSPPPNDAKTSTPSAQSEGDCLEARTGAWRLRGTRAGYERAVRRRRRGGLRKEGPWSDPR
jgi:hypothetical protein